MSVHSVRRHSDPAPICKHIIANDSFILYWEMIFLSKVCFSPFRLGLSRENVT